MSEQSAGDAPALVVRTAVAGDVPALLALINEAYAVEKFFIAGDRTDAPDLRRHMHEGEFLVAESVASGIQGGVYVRMTGERGYFGMLSVDPGSQGVGLGLLLVERAESYCLERGARWMDLLVVNLREELPPWYQRLGYAKTGTKPFSPPSRLKRPAHFIKMSKQLI